jgi:hypothetical protein
MQSKLTPRHPYLGVHAISANAIVDCKPVSFSVPVASFLSLGTCQRFRDHRLPCHLHHGRIQHRQQSSTAELHSSMPISVHTSLCQIAESLLIKRFSLGMSACFPPKRRQQHTCDAATANAPPSSILGLLHQSVAHLLCVRTRPVAMQPLR